MAANFAPVDLSTRLHLRTASKSLPAVVDIDADSSTSSPPSSPERYNSNTAEKCMFRAWQYPSSPELSDDEQKRKRDNKRSSTAALDRVQHVDPATEPHSNNPRTVGFHSASRPSVSRRLTSMSITNKVQRSQVDHRPTASMPYGYQTASNSVANAAAVVAKRGPAALLPYLFANLRRARYKDLFFGLVFAACLGMFLSALGGVGYTSDIPFSPASRVVGGVVADETTQGYTEDPPAPLMITPISPHGEKDDTPLFADFLPHKRRPASKKPHVHVQPPPPLPVDKVVVDFSQLEADSAMSHTGGKPYVEPHDEGKPDLVGNSPDDPRLDDEHADHPHHEMPDNIFGLGRDREEADDEHHYHEHHEVPLHVALARQQALLREDGLSAADQATVERDSPDATVEILNLYTTDEPAALQPDSAQADYRREGSPIYDGETQQNGEVGYRERNQELNLAGQARQGWSLNDERETREVEELTGRRNLRLRRLR